MTIQIKATEQYFPVVLFVYYAVEGGSVDEILKCALIRVSKSILLDRILQNSHLFHLKISRGTFIFFRRCNIGLPRLPLTISVYFQI